MTAREWCRENGSPIATLMLASVIIGASIGFSARAHADPSIDRAYIQTLDHYSVPYSSEAGAISAGYGICAAFDGGSDFMSVVRSTMRSGGLTMEKSAREIGAAVGAYCGEYEYLFQPSQGRVIA